MNENAMRAATELFLHVRYGAAYEKAIDTAEFGTARQALTDAQEMDGRELLLYCCDELERMVQAGDMDKARDFADAAHNLPKCFDGSGAFMFDAGFWNEYIAPFRAKYGEEYFAAFNDGVVGKTRRSIMTEKLRALNATRNAPMRESRVKGSIFGGAIGDALGYAVEFSPLSAIRARYGRAGIRDYSLTNGVALFSDDTQMTLFTAAGLMLWEGRRASQPDIEPERCIYEAYLDWYATQSFSLGLRRKPATPLYDVPELHSSRAPGATCTSALRSGSMGTLEKPLNASKGCGGVMRVAPIGLRFGPDALPQNETVLLGAKAAVITHGHPLGFISAAGLVYIVNEITYGRGDSLVNIVLRCKDVLKELFAGYPDVNEMNRLLDRAVTLAEQSIDDADAIAQLGEGWVGDEALAIAVYCCLKHTDSFENAICAAVNHSGDSDSTGAVAGNIMGAYLGYEAIPKKYIAKLELPNLLAKTAAAL